jgi:uncharacterized membrane protein YjjP (DUF1212 family)
MQYWVVFFISAISVAIVFAIIFKTVIGHDIHRTSRLRRLQEFISRKRWWRYIHILMCISCGAVAVFVGGDIDNLQNSLIRGAIIGLISGIAAVIEPEKVR